MVGFLFKIVLRMIWLGVDPVFWAANELHYWGIFSIDDYL